MWRDKMDGWSNERSVMGPCANVVEHCVVQLVKRNTLRWFGHIERKQSEEFVKKGVC